MKNKITSLFNIKYPIIQAGMIWCSGWKLASAVSNAGGLGIIGSGSMYPEILKDHIIKCKSATNHSFAVNLPLLYPNAEEHIQSIIDLKVPIVFTSAGNPKTWTKTLKSKAVLKQPISSKALGQLVLMLQHQVVHSALHFTQEMVALKVLLRA